MKVEFVSLMKELKKAYPFIGERWPFQNNEMDKKTNFIYRTISFKQVAEQISENKVNDIYTYHRWYNFHASITTEKLFVENGCIPNPDKTDKFVDLYFKDIPYDIKLTVYPRTIDKILNLKKRSDKNELCNWFYENQSQQQRKHLKNRLFVVCKSDNYTNSLKLKVKFDLIEEKVKEFIKYHKDYKLNQIIYKENNNEYKLYSDIILVEEII